MRNFKTLAAIACLSFTATGAVAESWTLDPALSKIAFGSVKNEYVGEIHSFGQISGSVNADGIVNVSLDLGSVETLIDIRNERMVEYVFDNVPNAEITAEVEMGDLTGLAVGEATTTEAFATLSLIGQEIDMDAEFFVIRLSDSRVMVTTDSMVMLSTDSAGIDAGIDTLQEIAGLDSITRVSPVTMRLVFDLDA